MMDNILKLAELQDSGDIPPAAEDAIALLFAERHALELRHVAAWGRWLSYDGTRWARDDTLHAFDRARAICREVAADCEKAAQRGRVAQRPSPPSSGWPRRIADWPPPHRNGTPMAGLSTQEMTTMEAATFDLRTGIGRAPDPLDYITKKTACRCAPAGTPHPLWTKFLDRITDDNAELQGFLQRYMGYCCTGFTTEHVFVFAYGTGANGKSTFINTIARIFGDYATVADMSTFIASNVEHHPTDLAKLRGARLVVAQETQKGRRWDETKIKALTGGDKITARFMRQDFFDFVPTFKLFICGNHKPRLDQRGRGHAAAPAAGAVHGADPAGRARPATGREAQGRVAGDPALVHRRLPGVAAHRPGAARDRARRHRGVLRRPGHAAAVARRLHRGRRPVCLQPHRRTVRVLEDVGRGPQPEAGQRAGLVRGSRGSRLRKSPQQHRPARVPQPYHQTP